MLLCVRLLLGLMLMLTTFAWVMGIASLGFLVVVGITLLATFVPFRELRP